MNANDSKKGLIEEIRSDLTSSTLLPTIIAGLLSGVITITFMYSYTAVIFTGELTQFVPRATAHKLVGPIIISVIVGLFGQFRGVVALPQDNPTAIIAVMVVAMSGALGSAASPDALFIHATVIIFLSTICAGLLFIAIGRWQLGALVQHVPYPVIAGFLAGTGWLLFKGSFGVMADVPFEFGNLSALIKFTPLWLP